MSHSTLPDDWVILLNGMADDVLTRQQEEELACLLQTNAEFRREYARFCQLIAQLTWNCPSEQSRPAPGLGEPGTTTRRFWARAFQVKAIRLSIPKTVWLAVSAVVIPCLIWLISNQFHQNPGMQLTHISGQVELFRNQDSFEVHAETANRPFPLNKNDRVRTGRDGSATIELADLTEIRLRPNTEFILSSGHSVRMTLSRGSLVASVTPQPSGTTLTFATGNAEVQVLGTELEILSSPEQSEVAVLEGKVHVTRKVDGSSADVSRFQFVSIKETGPLSVVHWHEAPDDWHESFDEGLPQGWTGRLLRNSLPTKSRGAVAAVPAQQSLDPLLTIRSPLEPAGLFVWHDDSVLHLTYKIPPPGWFHICLLAHSYNDSKSVRTYCCLKPELWQQSIGDWTTVSIPLSEFRPVSGSPDESTLGRIPVQISFNGKSNSTGFVIDHVSVDRTAGETGARR